MTLPASGAISFSNIDTELGLSATAQIGLNCSAVRTLFGQASGAICMNTGHGKSNTSVPGAPTIGTATATGVTTATVTFTAPTCTGHLSITGYQSISSPGCITATGSSSPISFSGLSGTTSYTFKVRAQNSLGYGAYSGSSNSITTCTPTYYYFNSLNYGNSGPGLGSTPSGGIVVSANKNLIIGQYMMGAGGLTSLTQCSNYGTNNWSKKLCTYACRGSTGAFTQIAVDSSNNVYASIGNGTASCSSSYNTITKFNSAGTVQWAKYWGQAYGLGGYPLKVLTDSSNNVYVVCKNCYRSKSSNKTVVTKFNSSGCLSWSKATALDTTNSGGTADIDSSANIYVVGNGTALQSGCKFSVVKFTSSGCTVKGAYITGFCGTSICYYCGSNQGGNFVSVSVAAGTVAVGGSSFWHQGCCCYTCLLTAHRYNSCLAYQWSRAVSPSCSFQTWRLNSIPLTRVDSSGNIYILSVSTAAPTAPTGRTNLLIMKFNSSGTLQWQRSLYNSSYNIASNPPISAYIDNTGSGGLWIATNMYVGTKQWTLYIKLPLDGSRTGTYTTNGYSITYAATSHIVHNVTASANYTLCSFTSTPSASWSSTTVSYSAQNPSCIATQTI
jgi:hypothetical protein